MAMVQEIGNCGALLAGIRRIKQLTESKKKRRENHGYQCPVTRSCKHSTLRARRGMSSKVRDGGVAGHVAAGAVKYAQLSMSS